MRTPVAFVSGMLAMALVWWLWPPPGAQPAAPPGTTNRTQEAPPEQVGAPDPESVTVPSAQGEAATASAEPYPDDPVQILLYGTVRDASGDLVEKGRVSLNSGSTWKYGAVAGGTYAIAGLPPGEWQLISEVRDVGYLERAIEVSSAPTTQRLDLTLNATTRVPVRFETSDGEPLHDALRAQGISPWQVSVAAVATLDRPTEDLPLTEARGHDRWEIGTYHWFRTQDLDVGYHGVIEAREPPPFFVSATLRHRILATEPVDADTEGVTFVIDVDEIQRQLASVRLRVLDAETRAPIEATVDVSDSQSGGRGLAVDAEGTVVVEGKPPGLLELTIHSSDHEVYSRWITLEPGQTLDLGEIELHRGRTVSGVLVDGEGAPTRGGVSCIQLERMLATDDRGSRIGHARNTDDQGSFEIPRVGRGRYLVFSSDSGFARDPVLVNTEAGDVTDVTVVREAGIEVLIQHDADRDHAIVVQITNDQAWPVYSTRRSWRQPIRLRLTKGRYTVRCIRPSGAATTRTLRVEDAPIEIGLRR